MTRVRAGSYRTFEKRYEPIEDQDGCVMRDWKEIPSSVGEKNIWTVVDCDGKLYLTPGYATVNYLGRVQCKNPWPDWEFNNPGYVY